jgi:hypothetical protein
MQNKSFRLTDNQISLINQLANLEDKKVNHIMRELIDIGLREKGISSQGNNRVNVAPRYATMATSCAVETLILMRKFVEKSSPDLIDIAKELASKILHKEDLAELIRF